MNMGDTTVGALNRVFILGGKGVSEDEWTEAFSKFGNIKSIYRTKDRNTGEDKGITYITFGKTSEACRAIEEMNGQRMTEDSRPIKVILASDKKDGARRPEDENQMFMRLFIKISRDSTEEDIREHFQKFGEIDYIRILRDRNAGKGYNRGLAYVKYKKQSEGSRAYEECDQKYKAIYADAQGRKKEEDPHSDAAYGRSWKPPISSRHYEPWDVQEPSYPSASRGGYNYNQPTDFPTDGPMDVMRNYSSRGSCKIEALLSSQLNQEQAYRLFDLFPGLDGVQFDHISGRAEAQYTSPQCAAFAREKLHGFEYPLGCRTLVRECVGNGVPTRGGPDLGNMLSKMSHLTDHDLSTAGAGMTDMNINNLVQSIQKATQVLQTAGINAGGLGESEHLRWCSTPLPYKKPLASRDADMAERLFIVSVPDSFPGSFMEDAFSRFGNLMGAYFVTGKNYGYAKYSDKDSAAKAMEVLHGQTILGRRLKVLLAEPPRHGDGSGDGRHKRMRVD